MAYKTTGTENFTAEQYIENELNLLREFDIMITYEIEEHMAELYPNECAMDNYKRMLIKQRLEK